MNVRHTSNILKRAKPRLSSALGVKSHLSTAGVSAEPKEQTRSYEEIKIPVPWGHISGKWWGPQKSRPVIALHGWQDNAGTFDRLIPLLPKKMEFLAIDAPGHGLSSPLPKGVFYHAVDGTTLLHRLKTYFGWPHLSLLGHSMGGMMSFLYSAMFPQCVDVFVIIDALKPISFYPGSNIERSAKNIEKFIKYDDLNNSDVALPEYDYEDLVQKWHEGSKQSVLVENVPYILNRTIQRSDRNPNKYIITRDVRLKIGALIGMMHEDLLEYAKRISCPVLIIKAKGSRILEMKEEYYFETLENMQSTNKNVEYHVVEGTHHLHLNTPENVSELIGKFLEKHIKL